MYPFEVWNEELQRIDFHFDKFREYQEELFQTYPVQSNHTRVEIDLIFPSDRLEDVWVHDWNPHHEIGNTHLSVYDCFYDSSNWSTIFEVYPTHDHNQRESWRCFIEEGHVDPWGEPIRIMSTSSDIHDDRSHRFAYFRGKYWKILAWRNYSLPSWYETWLTQYRMQLETRWSLIEGAATEWVLLVDNPWGWAAPFIYVDKADWRKEGF